MSLIHWLTASDAFPRLKSGNGPIPPTSTVLFSNIDNPPALPMVTPPNDPEGKLFKSIYDVMIFPSSP